ncbi:UDP-4-amino-4-deoxy-L-arabinose--oxoglutarate aminotransferase [bioreactor metagenome]|uniref:UDP-4-amino-4-deoxy-L-arabinose--oxoglutarate aminotransferase n=1 Tax=bioreactor metagenome TaxID=1076179 RepID=A0A645EL93_9ZZZZ
MDPAEVEKHITPQTRAVLFVGVGGNVGHLDQIVNICKEHNLKLILDAAHMSGTRLNGECPAKYADVAVFSFQAVKNLPTADSGMICFREKELDEVVRKKTWLGINKDTYLRSSDNGTYKWKYDVEYVGYKYHGNSIMAAIALAQIKHLDKDNAYRRQIAKWYTDGFAPHSDKIKLVHVPGNCESSRHLFQILVENRDDLMTYLNKHDIYPGVHYVDNTEYRMYSYAKGECINAAYASEHLISLPLHMRLEFEDVQTVIKNVVVFITNEK